MKADTEIMTEFQINNWHKNKQKQTPLVNESYNASSTMEHEWLEYNVDISIIKQCIQLLLLFQNVMNRVKRVASHLRL